MGFKANGPVQLNLVNRLEGLVVLVHGRTVGEWLRGGADIDLSWENDESLGEDERLKRYRSLYADFVADVISWNLEAPDGTPVPVSVEGMESVDTVIATPMVSAWANRIVKLPDPLEPSSPDGKHSEPLSMPMAPSTPNPAS